MSDKTDKLAEFLERSNFQDWLDQQRNPWLSIKSNLIAGIARGFGMALGAGVVFGLAAAVFGILRGLFGV
jgi:hypothetical protein